MTNNNTLESSAELERLWKWETENIRLETEWAKLRAAWQLYLEATADVIDALYDLAVAGALWQLYLEATADAPDALAEERCP